MFKGLFGVEIFDYGIFWVGKFGFFILPCLEIKGSEIQHAIFWGWIFGPEIFWGFCWKPLWFFGVLIFCPHSIIPVTWNPEYPLPPGHLLQCTWKYCSIAFSWVIVISGTCFDNSCTVYTAGHGQLLLPPLEEEVHRQWHHQRAWWGLLFCSSKTEPMLMHRTVQGGVCWSTVFFL